MERVRLGVGLLNQVANMRLTAQTYTCHNCRQRLLQASNTARVGTPFSQAFSKKSARRNAFPTTKANEANPADKLKAAQAIPIGDFYQLMLDSPLTPSQHSAYYPITQPIRVPEVTEEEKRTLTGEALEEKIAEQEDLKARARVVFGSRLTGPQRYEAIDKKSQIIAGVKVPPKPEEPDNCCMSGCVNCVWDIFREDLETWAAAKTEAQKALDLQTAKTGKKSKKMDEPKKKRGRPAKVVVEATSMDDDGGRTVGGSTMWEGFEGIPVGIRAFMETEKNIKSRRDQRKEA